MSRSPCQTLSAVNGRHLHEIVPVAVSRIPCVRHIGYETARLSSYLSSVLESVRPPV